MSSLNKERRQNSKNNRKGKLRSGIKNRSLYGDPYVTCKLICIASKCLIAQALTPASAVLSISSSLEMRCDDSHVQGCHHRND